MPVNKKGNHYAYSENADLPNGGGHLGMVFPFSVDIHSELARNTISYGYKTFLASREVKSADQVLAYTWMWALSHLATALFYQGRADEGFDVLKQVPKTVGPFMAPNEQMRDDIGAYLTWYTTGGGMYSFALTTMFVQVVDENGAILLPAIPSELKSIRFHGLLATDGITVSGDIEDGKPVALTLTSGKDMKWRFRIAKLYFDLANFNKDMHASRPDELGRVLIECSLHKGVNSLIN